jgi:aldose 1-epimerase
VSEPRSPSGQQFEIRYAEHVAVVTEVGATIRHYGVAGHDVLDGFGDDEVCSGGRGQQLIPWPNRVRDGRYSFAGKRQQLAVTEPGNGNAIHGLVRWANWRAESVEPGRVVMTLALHPQPGWPGTLDLSVTVDVGESGLTVTTQARNGGSTDVPYGSGAHPYLTMGGARIDSATLHLPAASYAAPDDRGIPVDPRPVDGTPYDFREERRIDDLVLDTAYTDILRDPDGMWRVRLSDRETSSAATIWADETHPWLQLFTGDTLPAGRARAGLAVEPMTCGPDAFNTGEGLLVLGPGDRKVSRWGITPS